MIKTKRNSSQKYIFITTLLILAAISAGLVFYYFTGNKDSELSQNTTSNQSSNTNQDKDFGENTNSQSEPNNPLNNTNQIPSIEPPSDNTPFPIENARYRIDRNSENKFSAILYAVLNRPEQYDEYVAQLKEYKKEVSDYLTQRFGSDVEITWSPEDANSL